MPHILIRNTERLHKTDSWKSSAYAFVPYQTHFGELCGFADDVIKPGQGFGMHAHKNMEISTIVLSGSQAHKDNTGSEEVVDELCVQTMSAGTGIMHSEFNASSTLDCQSFQIWIYPKHEDVSPRHDRFRFKEDAKLDRVLMTISPDGRGGTATTNQDSYVSVSRLNPSKVLDYEMNRADNGVFIHSARGSVQIDNQLLHVGDSMGIYATQHLSIVSQQESELIFIEVPMARGIRLS